MEELKQSKKADCVGYLYRAALYLAQGDIESSLVFLEKSGEEFESAKLLQVKLLHHKNTITEKKRLMFAERVLDEYKRQLYGIFP